MKRTTHKLKALAFAAVTVLAGATMTGCVEDVPMENRFTFKCELISTYLENNPEKFSSFTTILSKARIGKKASGNLLITLSTYG